MFDKGVWVDGNWIADGYFFRRVEKVVKKSFMENFKAEADQAKITLVVMSNKFLFDDNLPCILLVGGGLCYPVQIRLLESVGVKLDDSEDYTFKHNPDTKFIYVYDEHGDLIGGLMPIVVGS